MQHALHFFDAWKYSLFYVFMKEKSFHFIYNVVQFQMAKNMSVKVIDINSLIGYDKSSARTSFVKIIKQSTSVWKFEGNVTIIFTI